jgi:glycosyltransferase involved in cell wall biosynthesis
VNILFILENYAPHIGGVETIFRNLCEGLAARGHKVTVITHQLPRTPKNEVINGVNVMRVPCLDSRYIFTFACIPKAISYAKDADIIHTTTFNAAPPAWLAARVRKKQVIITVHETWMGKWREYTDFSAPRAWIHEVLERAVFLPKYDRYVCVSESTARQLAAALPGQADRIATIHNGFDPGMWKKRRETAQLRKKLGLEGKFVILGFGRPGTSKGFQYLLGAFPEIKEHIPEATLLLILSRDRQYAKEVERMKERAHKDVVFLDPQPYKELPSYTQMADCIVVPSITEGFGYAALESVASGTPVVASHTTSIPEVIYGKHLLVPPKDPHAIATAVVKVKRGEYETAPQRKFPWSKAITAYENEYERLLKAKNGKRRRRAR